MASELRFNIFRDHAGEYRWQLLSRNGREIATSGEGYVRKVSCESAVVTICEYAAHALITAGEHIRPAANRRKRVNAKRRKVK